MNDSKWKKTLIQAWLRLVREEIFRCALERFEVGNFRRKAWSVRKRKTFAKNEARLNPRGQNSPKMPQFNKHNLKTNEKLQ